MALQLPRSAGISVWFSHSLLANVKKSSPGRTGAALAAGAAAVWPAAWTGVNASEKPQRAMVRAVFSGVQLVFMISLLE
jgi:hypothetical protein